MTVNGSVIADSEVVSWFGIAAALYLFICPLVTMRTILKTKTTGKYG